MLHHHLQSLPRRMKGEGGRKSLDDVAFESVLCLDLGPLGGVVAALALVAVVVGRLCPDLAHHRIVPFPCLRLLIYAYSGRELKGSWVRKMYG